MLSEVRSKRNSTVVSTILKNNGMNTYQDNSGFSSTRYVCVQPRIDNNHNSIPSACMNSLVKLITYACIVFENFWS